MVSLSNRHQLAVGTLLFVLLVITRGHPFPTLVHLVPSASLAVFFLAGVYLRPAWALPALLGIAGFLDYAAIAWGGVSDFCVSPAYVALLPAYGALWLAGRWYAGHHRLNPATLLALGTAVLAGTAVYELLSSGGFYFFSGRFTAPTLLGFADRFVIYFPRSLQSILFWVVVAALVHAAYLTLRVRRYQHGQTLPR